MGTLFTRFLLKTAANVGALWLARTYLGGVEFGSLPFSGFRIPWLAEAWQVLAILGVGLAIANLIARPVLKVAAAILPLITFPFLSIALNAALLAAAWYSMPAISFDGLRPLAYLAVILGVINAIF